MEGVLEVNTTSNGYINSNVKAGSSSAKYGTLRFMQNYTDPAYSSTGVSYELKLYHTVRF